MAGSSRQDEDAIKLIEQLRSKGAKRVRVGDIEVEYASPFLSPAPERAPETDGERRTREAREQEEREKTLFHSSG